MLSCCRDIKLENTLLDAHMPLPNVKLCDFGYSKNEFVDSRPKTVSGTPDYIAPEVLLNDQYDGKKADIWSCGVMLYVMLTGEAAQLSGKHSCMPCGSRAGSTCCMIHETAKWLNEVYGLHCLMTSSLMSGALPCPDIDEATGQMWMHASKGKQGGVCEQWPCPSHVCSYFTGSC